MSVELKEVISPKSSKPKYEQLKSYLLTQLVNGKYMPGDTIPSENKLAKEHNLAPSTVRQALGMLEKDGLVTRIRGKGTFVNKEEPYSISSPEQTIEAYATIIPVIVGGSYPLIVNGIEHSANEHNYRLLVCNSHNTVDTQANLILQLVYKKVSGVAIVPPTIGQPTPSYHVRILQDNNIPVVLHQRKVEGASAPLLKWSAEDVCKTVAKAMVEFGHKRIAYSGIYKYSLTEAYEGNLRSELMKYSLELPKENVFYGPYFSENPDRELSETHLNQIFDNKKSFSVIFCSSYTEAESIYLKAIEKNIKVPQELSIVAFGEKNPRGSLRNQISAAVVDEFAIGIKSGEVLHEMLTGLRSINNDEEIIIPVEFSKGKTLVKVV